ncbi:hypothetical protein BDM02DRAFT_3184041 [Thelephora ganbajun]|uniref:Uncharacterized protein n=1 Tax=Thelephora ganbajun TaxID=370292 RepID=A0ACB6ZRX5_THEGA|nr:hypothetical protein BDM02DRAFT_3184041 [Thelephora ganbajun]
MSDTIISFRALLLVNEQRNTYGLRYNDYTRYRKHCTNRTHRLRSSLKITHGKGREFKKLASITPEIVNNGHLQLLLFEAERAWAHSQELTTQSLDPAKADKRSALRHSATSRFWRAINWSTRLLSLAQSLYASKRLSAGNLLEFTIYTLILNGRFLRSREEQLQDALSQLCIARYLLDNLFAQATSSRDQALATLFIDEIGPEIRYCAHQLGNKKAYDVDGIVQELSAVHKDKLVEDCDDILSALRGETHSGTQNSLKQKLDTLMWEGKPVPIRNPELVDALLRVQEAEARLAATKKSSGGDKAQSGSNTTKRSVGAYDAVLSALSDSEEVARKRTETQQLSESTTLVGIGGRDIEFVHAFIVYQLLARRTERDHLLINALLFSHQPRVPRSSLEKEQIDGRLFPAVVKLLDTVLQNLTQMRTLSVVDESPDLASGMDARISFTKSRRCFFLARCYAPLRRYAEALTLVQRSQLHLREARSIMSTTLGGGPELIPAISFYPLADSDYDKLDEEVSRASSELKRDWFTFNGGSPTPDNGSHKKPLFFDIALNYVELDMDRLQQRAGKKPPPTPVPIKILQPQPQIPQAQKGLTVKAKAEEITSPATLEPKVETSHGGLSSLLGGWWGRK